MQFDSSGKPNSSVWFGINLVAEQFGSVRRTVRLVPFGRTLKLGKFGSVRRKNSLKLKINQIPGNRERDFRESNPSSVYVLSKFQTLQI